MWSSRVRRLLLSAAVLPLALVALRDAPTGPGPSHTDRHTPPPRPGPRPPIVTRAQWHADEMMVRDHHAEAGTVSAVFIHHTGHPNTYTCDEVPDMLKALQVEHVHGQGWDDIGYNFLVDRCGTIYEGRSGSVARPVRGSHTEGFNVGTVGIAAVGSYGPGETVPQALLTGIARVAAWKLRPQADPRGTVRLTSTANGTRYRKGQRVELPVISGHRDGHRTRCPGDALYKRLPEIRDAVARLRAR